MKLCRKCKNEISVERLEIIPEAVECSFCLKKLEYKQTVSALSMIPIPQPSNPIKSYPYRKRKVISAYDSRKMHKLSKLYLKYKNKTKPTLQQ